MVSLIQIDRQFQSMKSEILSAVEAVLDRGQFILGEEVRQFEQETAAYLQVPYAVSVGNGTDALVMALTALDIGAGDEVITTPFTFFATAEAISRVGATPVFADIDPQTYNLDPASVEARITPRTKAILPVHIFGQSCDMQQFTAMAEQYGLELVEDACQAFGAEEKGVKLGTIGRIGCYSFFPTKNLSTIGDGGMLVTKDGELAKRLRKLRHHGSVKKYYHDEIGFNSRLDEIHAAVLRSGLKHIDGWNGVRRALAHVYDSLNGKSGLSTPVNRHQGNSHIYHLYCVEHEQRDDFMAYLRTNNIASGSYYPLPLHLQQVYRQLGYKPGDLPVAERKSERLLALPLHPFLSAEEQQEVIEVALNYTGKE
ncbi:DegT/DnrJ/EryC1/StrS family aminotransferase [Paenibacillus piscarius]|uniref:DegT/DnrJ/EryC1/StrS family aminotransferase n=1 Tax=Paenibacillus piscarius TaxID=1089681 RepID=UPI001EE8DF18|nr:DegT/DnrJ/EryC1/StrS family aminotransferase [Paenibacillus piscarius]